MIILQTCRRNSHRKTTYRYLLKPIMLCVLCAYLLRGAESRKGEKKNLMIYRIVLWFVPVTRTRFDICVKCI